MRELLSRKAEWLVVLEPLKAQAMEFWHCCPFDRLKPTAKHRNITLWNLHSLDQVIGENFQESIDVFVTEMKKMVRQQFPAFLMKLEEEEARERIVQEYLSGLPHDVLNSNISTKMRSEFESKNQSFVVTAKFPCLHFTSFDTKFPQLMGMCRARVMCQPLLEFIFNTADAEECISGLNSQVRDLPSSILTYRTANRKLLRVQWQLSSEEINGTHIGRGFDITDIVETIQDDHVSATGKMLRQWLHSIRNASFAQQAEMILEDLQHLKSKVIDQTLEEIKLQAEAKGPAVIDLHSSYSCGTDSERIDSNDETKSLQTMTDFNLELLETFRRRVQTQSESLVQGLKTLMHTARSTVGIIDQALDNQDLGNQSSVADLVNSLRSVPLSFAKSEGYDDVNMAFTCLIDGEAKVPSNTSYVTGEVPKLQAILNNLVSNAVRYTEVVDNAPRVELAINIETLDNCVNFSISIRDFYPGGLPERVFRYIEEAIGESKCIDLRKSDAPVLIMKRGTNDCIGTAKVADKKMSVDVVEHTVDMQCEDSSHETKSSIKPHRDGTRTRSSGTGIPHIVELNNELTKALKRDFSMSVETSEMGTVYTVLFTLKTISPVESCVANAVTPLSTVEGQEKAILVVDDAFVVRQIMSNILKKMNVNFHMCADGVEALAWMKKNRQNCAALITDLEMPRMGGDALISEVRALDPDFLCYVVSGKEMQPGECESLGADGMVVKPISPARLQEVVKTIYDKQKFKKACS